MNTVRRMAREFLVLAAGLLLCLSPRVEAADNAKGVIEAVPTSQKKPAIWRYTFDAPSGDWVMPAFKDDGWKQGPGGFGTAGTPGAVVGTTWDTADIWMRREIVIPESPDPSTLKLMVYHDEDVDIYLDGILAAAASGFASTYQAMDINDAPRKLLKAGAKIVLAVHCHQTSGGQGVDVGLAQVPAGWRSGPVDADPKERAKERYRQAAFRAGDVAKGKLLFEDARLACVKCHAIDGKTVKVAPDLLAVGDKFSRREIVDSILSPSAWIAVGYETTIITTKSDEVVDGIVKDATDEALSLMAADGSVKRVLMSDVKDRRIAKISMMPEGLENGISPGEFADLVEYVVSLKLPETMAMARHGRPANIPMAEKQITLTPFVTPEHHFEHPDWIGQIPGQAGKFLVCEHETGKIWLIEKEEGKAGEQKSLFGDFGSEIRVSGSTGLLGVTFHPKFRENRKYYIQHEQMEDGRLYAFVSEKVISEDFRKDSGKPSRTIYSAACATTDHAGGGVEFGPDGMMYIAMGDTGPQGDPQGHGQDLKRPLGKMLRIDVEHSEGGKAYAIPADNPFVGRADALPEIWAYGFRQPWRFCFDSVTKELWVGDVGQDTYEEVDIVRPGENYGWNVYEGFEPFSSKYRRKDEKYVAPVFSYTRKFGNSVTGGLVYRADEKSPLYGVYIFGDYTSKRIFGLTQENRSLETVQQIAVAPQRIASFGRDDAGGIYVVGYEGMVYRMEMSGR
jgi:putative heme-binding domain-containing protein